MSKTISRILSALELKPMTMAELSDCLSISKQYIQVNISDLLACREVEVVGYYRKPHTPGRSAPIFRRAA